MFGILKHRAYRRLFAAQVIALIGTGLATVALGLLAWDIAGEDAGVVLGTALAIKMVAYCAHRRIRSGIPTTSGQVFRISGHRETSPLSVLS